MADLAVEKSTIVRPISHEAPLPLRAAFRTLGAFAPGLAGRLAERLWFTVPTPGSAALRPGPLGGEPFEVAAEGIRVAGQAWGNGRAVYLMHGWGGWATQLGAFVEPLVAAGYRVITFDAPSHGRSGAGRRGPRRTNALEFSAALAAVVAAHGPAHAVIGHSLGAIAVGDALDRGLAVDRLVFLAPMAAPANYLPVFGAALGLGRRTQVELVRTLERRLGQPMSAWDLPALGRRRTVPPLLLFHDAADPETSHGDSSAIAASWPGAELVTTIGLGHRRIVRDPAVVARAVEFVDVRSP